LDLRLFRSASKIENTRTHCPKKTFAPFSEAMHSHTN